MGSRPARSLAREVPASSVGGRTPSGNARRRRFRANRCAAPTRRGERDSGAGPPAGDPSDRRCPRIPLRGRQGLRLGAPGVPRRFPVAPCRPRHPLHPGGSTEALAGPRHANPESPGSRSNRPRARMFRGPGGERPGEQGAGDGPCPVPPAWPERTYCRHPPFERPAYPLVPHPPYRAGIVSPEAPAQMARKRRPPGEMREGRARRGPSNPRQAGRPFPRPVSSPPAAVHRSSRDGRPWNCIPAVRSTPPGPAIPRAWAQILQIQLHPGPALADALIVDRGRRERT